MKPAIGRVALALSCVLVASCGAADAPAPTHMSPAVDAVGSPAGSSFAPTEPIDGRRALHVACAIDEVDAQPIGGVVINVQAEGPMRVRGWVADAARNAPERFRIVLSGETTHAADAVSGKPRPDVARALAAAGLALSGFDVVTQLRGVPPGEYSLHLAAQGTSGQELCETRARVLVVAAPA